MRNHLFTQATHRAFEWGGPAVILGDFNGDYHEMKSWTEVGDIHLAKSGEALPATYQNEVRHDYMLLCPFMASRHDHSWVLRDHSFPC